MKYALWTREAVRELIAERYGVRYALQSLSFVLKRWGTPQRPLKRAYDQRPAEVKCWLQEEYPPLRPSKGRECRDPVGLKRRSG